MRYVTFRRTAFAVLVGLASSVPSNSQPGLVSERPVAPGVVLKQFTLPGPYTLDVLQVQLGTPHIALEAYRPNGLTKTSVQAAANDRDGHRVVAAVNADFFSFATGWPDGNQVVNGEIVHGLASKLLHFTVDAHRHPSFERLTFSGVLLDPGGSSHAIAGVNDTRAAGTLEFYTPYRGTTTKTDSGGTECAVEFLNPPRAGDTLRACITAEGPGNLAIPSGGGVLSAASGETAAFLAAAVHTGDTVRIVLGYTTPAHTVMQSLGGRGRILTDVKSTTDSMNAQEGITVKFTGARHPRTFVGFNADTSTFYMCTVDGRQASSIGMTFAEMASFMLSLGGTQAFNFDGGGSTTMVVRGSIVNSPSDSAGERKVANSLQLVSIAPPGRTASVSAAPDRVDVFSGHTVQFTASALDEYGNPTGVPADAVWEADPALGTISVSGLFTATHGGSSGHVRIRCGAVTDSAAVTVVNGSGGR
jgi:hypothetical protein